MRFTLPLLGAILLGLTAPLRAAEVPSSVFDARAYGAVGDDATDNTAAFSRCLAAVVAAGGGRMT
jgi:polygalacturonase